MGIQVIYDFIVVGSGATGAQAGQTLVESGASVATLDGGKKDTVYCETIPDKDFISIRNTDENQHFYFLGKDYEGIPWGNVRLGSQLTPPRNFLIDGVDRWLPIKSDTFSPMESLARGGLGGGWGAGCYVFSPQEIQKIGLIESDLSRAYEVVAQRIGISGDRDDAAPYSLNNLETAQPAIRIDNNLAGVYKAYQTTRAQFNRKGFFMGRTVLAALTKDTEGRKAIAYNDMEFWSDRDRSIYRAWMTIEQLMKYPNFTYHSNVIVLNFKEMEAHTEVIVKDIDTEKESVFKCKNLILASGVLGTARIVMRAFDYQKNRLPILCNPYCYIPCLQLRMLGRATEQFKSSLSQLILYWDEKGDHTEVSQASFFSYRSLLLFKLLKESPLNFQDSRIIFQYLQLAFTIAGIHHPESGGPQKYIELVKDKASPTGDSLRAEYVLSNDEVRKNHEREKKYMWALRKLGCLPLGRIYPGHGSSIHYAGTLPFGDSGTRFSLSRDGRLGGTNRVFVADGSGFKYLPAKGLTLTLMANSHRVAENAIRYAQGKTSDK